MAIVRWDPFGDMVSASLPKAPELKPKKVPVLQAGK